MSSSEFTHWLALDAIEPLQDRRQDYYLAQLSQILFNVNRGAGQSALDLQDFLLFQNKPPPSPDEVEAQLRFIFGGMASAPKET